MPEYAFVDCLSHESVDLFFEMGEAPKIGQTCRHEGRTLIRVPSRLGAPKVRNYSFRARSLPREDVSNPTWPCDATGVPVFESKAQVEEYHARSEGQAIYDDGP